MEKLLELGFGNVTQFDSGIYILVYWGKVLYVGQSIDCFARIGAHKSARGQVKKGNKKHGEYDGHKTYMLFDEVYFLPCKVEELDELERKYIILLGPRFNRVVGNGYHGHRGIMLKELPAGLEEEILQLAGNR